MSIQPKTTKKIKLKIVHTRLCSITDCNLLKQGINERYIDGHFSGKIWVNGCYVDDDRWDTNEPAKCLFCLLLNLRNNRFKRVRVLSQKYRMCIELMDKVTWDKDIAFNNNPSRR